MDLQQKFLDDAYARVSTQIDTDQDSFEDWLAYVFATVEFQFSYLVLAPVTEYNKRNCETDPAFLE